MPKSAEMPKPGANDGGLTIYRAAAVRGLPGEAARPGAAAVSGGRVLEAGPTDLILRRHASGAVVVDRPGELLLPGLVNAHAHLELTNLGPRPYRGPFTKWLREVLAQRPADVAATEAAIRRGVSLSLQGGVEVLGDIGGLPEADGLAQRCMSEAGLRGVAFRELIGLSPQRVSDALQRLGTPARTPRAADAPVRAGLQPHAPYSTHRTLFAAATACGRSHDLPLCTHLAETPDEQTFVAGASGPLRTLLETLGIWSDAMAEHYRRGQSPVEWFSPFLGSVPWLLAHCNYLSDADIAALARSDASVAYCPIASAYFGHVGHRYRDLLDAGVNVCLGTDSMLCQPPDEHQPLSIFPAMRHLYQRDGVDAQLLLRMGTTHGRKALGVDDTVRSLIAVRFDPDDPRDALVQALGRREPIAALRLG